MRGGIYAADAVTGIGGGHGTVKPEGNFFTILHIIPNTQSSRARRTFGGVIE